MNNDDPTLPSPSARRSEIEHQSHMVGRITQLTNNPNPTTTVFVGNGELVGRTAQDIERKRLQNAEFDADRESGVLDVVTMSQHLEVASVALRLEQEVERLNGVLDEALVLLRKWSQYDRSDQHMIDTDRFINKHSPSENAE